MFVGEYVRSVDGAGRLALPAGLRAGFDGRCYMTCHPDGNITLSTVESFEAAANRLMEEIRSGEKAESALRAFGANTQFLSIDKQGRINFDDDTLRHAGLTDEAVIVGVVTTVEIWRPSRYRIVSSEHDQIKPPRQWDDEDDS
ncbi:MAG: hypothetical protein CSA55_02855 [Ilumatobacter coccineus]|uniref:Transcriptional regulator MraZ n=1 Tax=Ilumatobacter coccineus TaxID=467094 RepID=A0A2G6KD15_9ACTN|nr:MAG: hypothetical protein CSA55_02855 [Ilumatobacter coccineus]